MKRLTWGAAAALLGTSLALAAPPAPPDKPPADTTKPAPPDKPNPPDKPPTSADKPPADTGKAAADEDFVKQVSAAGLAEINFGRLAAQDAANPDVRAFGQRMVQDHGQANEQLNRIADAAGITPAPAMDGQHQELFNKLVGMRGDDFDRQYVASQVADHKAAVALLEAESKNGKNADLKALAGKLLPTVKDHLDMAQKLAGAEKNPEPVKKPDADKKPDQDKKPDADKKPEPDKKPDTDRKPLPDKEQGK